MKKPLTLALCLIAVCFSFHIAFSVGVTFASAAEFTNTETMLSDYYENTNKSIEVYNDAISPYKTIIKDFNGEENVTYSDNFAGVFIDDEGLLNIGLVELRQSASSFNGRVRYKQCNFTYNYLQEYTTAWSPITFGHLCYYVNGMLSMPGATEGLINIFEVDAATMQYSAASFAADVATYGLFTYEEFAAIITIPEVIFEAFNGQYLKVSIGKGLIDIEGLVDLVERYADFFPQEDTNIPDDQNGNGNGNSNHNGHGNGNEHGNGNGNGNGHANGHHNGHRRKGR